MVIQMCGKGLGMGSGMGGFTKAFNQTPTGWVGTEPRYICQTWSEILGPRAEMTSYLPDEMNLGGDPDSGLQEPH